MAKITMTAGNFAPLPQGKTGRRRSLSDLAVRLFDAFGTWNDRAGQRRTLAAASDQVLSDIGLSRLDAEGEAEKPFWRR